MSVRILVTGGTFDKEYDEIKGQLYFKDTHMREILELGRSRLDVKIRTLMLVDSLDMTNTDRLLILENCRAVEEDQIVITHGTDTMTKTGEVMGTAQYLAPEAAVGRPASRPRHGSQSRDPSRRRPFRAGLLEPRAVCACGGVRLLGTSRHRRSVAAPPVPRG